MGKIIFNPSVEPKITVSDVQEELKLDFSNDAGGKINEPFFQGLVAPINLDNTISSNHLLLDLSSYNQIHEELIDLHKADIELLKEQNELTQSNIATLSSKLEHLQNFTIDNFKKLDTKEIIPVETKVITLVKTDNDELTKVHSDILKHVQTVNLAIELKFDREIAEMKNEINKKNKIILGLGLACLITLIINLL